MDMSFEVADNIEKRFQRVQGSRIFRNLISDFSLDEKVVLDIGCSYGEYLSHFGAGSMGLTIDESEAQEGKRRGLNVIQGNIESNDLSFSGQFEVIWANNLFEHLIAPHRFLVKIKKHLSDDGVLILGVPVVPWPTSLMKLKKFRGALASNHVNFFTKDTLRLSVERAGWEINTTRPFFFSLVILDKFFSIFMPHQYVIAKKIKDFQYPDKKLNEWGGDEMYTDLIDS